MIAWLFGCGGAAEEYRVERIGGDWSPATCAATYEPEYAVPFVVYWPKCSSILYCEPPRWTVPCELEVAGPVATTRLAPGRYAPFPWTLKRIELGAPIGVVLARREEIRTGEWLAELDGARGRNPAKFTIHREFLPDYGDLPSLSVPLDAGGLALKLETTPIPAVFSRSDLWEVRRVLRGSVEVVDARVGRLVDGQLVADDGLTVETLVVGQKGFEELFPWVPVGRPRVPVTPEKLAALRERAMPGWVWTEEATDDGRRWSVRVPDRLGEKAVLVVVAFGAGDRLASFQPFSFEPNR